MENKKGTATNRKGMGSTYAGTQSPDPKAPDGYQEPSEQEKQKKDKQQPDKEDPDNGYDSSSSYGDQGKAPEAKGTAHKSNKGDTAEGTPVR